MIKLLWLAFGPGRTAPDEPCHCGRANKAGVLLITTESQTGEKVTTPIMICTICYTEAQREQAMQREVKGLASQDIVA